MDRFLWSLLLLCVRNVLLLASREKAGEYKSTAFLVVFQVSDCSKKITVRRHSFFVRRDEKRKNTIKKTFLMKRTYH